MAFSTVNDKNLIVIPKTVRDRWGLSPGDKINVVLDESRNEVILRKLDDVKTVSREVEGIWKKRADLPDMRAVREELDERT